VIKTFQKIIKNNPEQSEEAKKGELSIAKCYFKLGDVKEALKRFKLLVQKFPHDAVAQEALVWMGNHYIQIDDLKEAITHFEAFANDFPGSEKINLIRLQLGEAYRAHGELDKAIEMLKKVDDLNSREIYAKAQLAITEIFSSNLDSESTIQSYYRIIEKSPEFKRDAHVKIAEVYKNHKQYEKSIEEYLSALSASRELSTISNAEIQFYLADVYELFNNPKKAMEEYFKIPYLYPQEVSWNVKAYLRIARIYENNEQWPEAENIYDKIIKLNTEELKFAQERLEWIAENISDRNL